MREYTSDPSRRAFGRKTKKIWDDSELKTTEELEKFVSDLNKKVREE